MSEIESVVRRLCRLKRAHTLPRAVVECIQDAVAQLNAAQIEINRLKAEAREREPYSPEEVELFQTCFDRGLLNLDDLMSGSRDEKVARARNALDHFKGSKTCPTLTLMPASTH